MKGGGVRIDSTYSLLGDTGTITVGSGSTTLDNWGWTIGDAISNRWTTFAEYDHIGAPSVTVPFPTVAVINASNIAVKQSADLFKLGVNYKFDFAP